MASDADGQPHDGANARPPRRDLWMRVIALLAIGFGLLTIKEGGATLSGDVAAVAAAGNVVPFVLWFNFVAGFAYVAAGAGLWLQRRWAAWLAIAIAAATALVFAALGVHVASGGAYELRTVAAMTLRLLVWSAIAAFAWRRLLHGDGAAAQTRSGDQFM